MKLPVPKLSALVVSAIRNLRETRGSTSKDIMNYILSEHRAEDAAIQRQLNAALKRGLDYGILRRVNGHYTLKTDPFGIGSPYAMIPEERSKPKRRRRKGSRRMRRGRRGRGARRTRRSRRGRGGHRRTRKVTMKPERRVTMARNKEIVARRLRKMDYESNDKCPSQAAPSERMHVDNRDPTEDRPANVEIPRRASTINNNNNKERDRSRSRSRRSQSQPRQQTRQETPPARSPSRSSESSDRDDQDDNRQDD